MAFKDGWDEFVEDAYGRDFDAQHDLYANFEKVAAIEESLNNVKTNEIENARLDTEEALNKLNNTKGVAENVGQLNSYDQLYTYLNELVDGLVTTIDTIANDIKIYEEASEGEHIASSTVSSIFKLGEGGLGIIETGADWIDSGLAWITSFGGLWENSVSDYFMEGVETDWSSEIFDDYWDTDFAKTSNITRDSGLANCLEICGSIITFCGISEGIVAPVIESTVGSTVASTTILGKTVTVSANTIANTGVAYVTGTGAAQEKIAANGGSVSETFWGGNIEGAKDAGLVFLTGTAADSYTANKAAKAATSDISGASNDAEKVGKNFTAEDYKMSPDAYDDLIAEGFKPGTAEWNAELTRTGSGTPVELTDEAADAATKATKTFTAEDYKMSPDAYDDLIAEGFKPGTAEWNAELTRTGVGTPADLIDDAADKADDVLRTSEEASSGATKTETRKVKTDILDEDGNVLKTSTEKVKITGDGTAVDSSDGFLSTLKSKVAGATSNIASKTTAAAATVASPIGVNAATVANVAGNNANLTPSDNSTAQFKTKVEGISNNTGGGLNKNNNGIPNGNVDIVDENTPTGGTEPENNDDSGGGYSPSGGSPSNSTASAGNDTANTQFDTGGTETTATETPATTTTTPTDTAKNTTTTTPTETKKDTTTTTPSETKTTTPSDTSQTTVIDTNTPTTNTETSQSTNTGGGEKYTATTHTGGGYSASSGYVSSNGTSTTTPSKSVEGTTTSIDEIIKGNNRTYKQIPKSGSVINKHTTSGGAGSSVIPVAAGLAAAAAAGIGAKAYIDRKNNNDNGEDDFESEEWSENDNLDIDYDDSSDTKEETLLDDDQDYAYQEVEEEKYGARNNEELADLQ